MPHQLLIGRRRWLFHPDSSLFTLPEREAFISNKMAEAYKLKGDYQNALQFALVAVDIAIRKNRWFNDYDKASYYVNCGDIYNRLHVPDSAITKMILFIHRLTWQNQLKKILSSMLRNSCFLFTVRNK